MVIIIFCLLFLTAHLVSFWVFLPLALCYALWRPAYELIVIGIFIDAQFGLGAPGFPYLYTVTLGLVVLCLEVLKPHLSFYNT